MGESWTLEVGVFPFALFLWCCKLVCEIWLQNKLVASHRKQKCYFRSYNCFISWNLFFFLPVCILSGWRLGRWWRAALWAPHSSSGLHGILQGSSHPPAEPQLWWISTLHGCRKGCLWWCEITFAPLNTLFKMKTIEMHFKIKLTTARMLPWNEKFGVISKHLSSPVDVSFFYCCRCMTLMMAWKHLTSCHMTVRHWWLGTFMEKLPSLTGAHQGNVLLLMSGSFNLFVFFFHKE